MAALAVTLLLTTLLSPDGKEAIDNGRLLVAAMYFGLFVVAQATVLHFEVQRHSFTLYLTEIPLILALFYMPQPLLMVSVRVLSLFVVQTWQRVGIIKRCFNAAS